MDPGLGIAGRQKPTSRLHPYVHLQRVREGLEVLLQFDRTVEQRDRGGLFKLSPCKCLFRIRKEGADESAPIELERNLKKDNSYTLLVVLTDGKPVFNLVEDYPPNPETSGIYVYNLLKDVPLQATVGEGQALQVPYSATPTLLRAEQVLGKTVTISAIIKNKTRVLMTLDYTGTKISAVLLRNRYQQPYLLLSTARPPGE